MATPPAPSAPKGGKVEPEDDNALDSPRRVDVKGQRHFKCVVKDIRIKNETSRFDPLLVLTLGGDLVVDDRTSKGRGIVRVMRRRGRRIGVTEHIPALGMGESAMFKRSYIGHWLGSYEDLSKEFFHIELYDYERIRSNRFRGMKRIPLVALAAGSIQQQIEVEHEKEGQTANLSATITFLLYFQELFPFRLHFLDWQGANLRAADITGTSDPYVIHTVGERKGLFRGVGRRQCKSPVIMNTLFPRWDDSGSVYFRGMWSELENEVLHFKVYDWDRLSKDDLIGFADIPLRGLLDAPYIKFDLGFNEGKGNIVGAGTLQGTIDVPNRPYYRQIGDIVELKQGIRYLAVRINEVRDLRPNVSGVCNPFVVVEWDGCKQETKVIPKTVHPHFDETLYIPVRAFNLNEAELKKKGHISIRCFDMQASGNDIQGGCDIPLWMILHKKNLPVRKGDIKSRFYQEAGLVLRSPMTGGQDPTISVACWFQPDLAAKITMEEDPFFGKTKELPEEYVTRRKRWRRHIPKHLRTTGKYPIHALDEDKNSHFLPTFLCVMSPPDSGFTPRMALRMVHSMTFQSDEDARVTQASGEHIWSTPNFFSEVKKGDSEDHALLLCCLLLGMKMDAYLCIGKTTMNQDHVWVMTREDAGVVRFWETTLGTVYKLEQRWAGSNVTEASIAEGKQLEEELGKEIDERDMTVGEFLRRREADAKKKKSRLFKKRQEAEERKEKERKEKERDEEMKKRKEENEMIELTRQNQINFRYTLKELENIREEDFIFFDTDITLPADYNPGDFGESMGVNLLPTPSAEASQAGAIRIESEQQQRQQQQQATFERGAHDDDDDDDDDDGDGGAGVIPPPNVPFPDLEMSHDLPKVALPYQRLEVVFNHENLWANLQHPHPARILYNFNEKAYWLPFISFEDDFMPEPPPTTFYGEARHLGPKLPEVRVDGICDKIVEEITAGYSNLRHGMSLRTTFNKKLGLVLQKGLSQMEELKLTDDSERIEKLHNKVAYWKGQIVAATPGGYTFRGTPISFSYTDEKRIFKYISKAFDFHMERHEGVQFAVGARVFPFPNSVCSVWVYVAKIVPKD